MNTDSRTNRPAEPLVSVLMPAHNAEETIGAAIMCILEQSIEDLELIIINDGSSDSTAFVLAHVRDSRLRVIHNPGNKGISFSLNVGVDAARGRFVARMDADDLCHVDRLKHQTEYLEAHPDVDVCGTFIDVVNSDGETDRWTYPTEHDAICAELLFNSSMAHGTAMFRREVFAEKGVRYDPHYDGVEDYMLWCLLAPSFRMGNVDKCLYTYQLDGQTSQEKYGESRQLQIRQVQHQLLLTLGLEPSYEEGKFHYMIGQWKPMASENMLKAVSGWFVKLARANSRSGFIEKDALSQSLAKRYFLICKRATGKDVDGYAAFASSPWKKRYRKSLVDTTGLLMRSALRKWNRD